MKPEEFQSLDPAGCKGVWCCAEQRHGNLMPTIYELLNGGRKLAGELGEGLFAVLIGSGVGKSAQDLIDHGADKVYVYDHAVFGQFVDETYALALADLIGKEKPSKVLIPASTMGKSLAARLAVITNTGLAADVTDLSVDPSSRSLVAVRPTFGGGVLCKMTYKNCRPEIATVRPMAFSKAGAGPGRKGEVVKLEVDPERFKSAAKFVKYVAEGAGEVDLTTAEKIVSGGRGVGKAEGFQAIRHLAETIGGAVGASRAAVDSGWIPYRHQVGLTGKTVRPKVYFACGISGQIQHLAGMSSSDTIIAINTDPEAPLMGLATFSIEGNLYEVVPAVVEEIKKRK